MANKYSKSNNSSKAREHKTMEDYRNDRKRLNTGAKVMALIIIVTMVFFYVLSSGLAFFE
ncbi:MAG: hypothetical protein IKE85_01375 [Mogibacterium sp.]|nr:hypothetical protein [Mogibacterium sp.]MBR2539467.1 hypothetical protein [Mogibacterium sp.]